jgi:hypothetical protein
MAELALEPGDHVCGFYWGVEGRDELLLPYLRAGLEAGDTCICVVHATEPAAVIDKIGQDIDVQRRLSSHQLNVQTAADSYLRGGYFDTNEMVEFFETLVKAATAGGRTARIAGEGAWALEGAPGVDQLIDYESELNRFVVRYRQMILCLYDLDLFGGGLVVDLLKTHPKIVLGGMVLENPHFMSPDEFRASRDAELN